MAWLKTFTTDFSVSEAEFKQTSAVFYEDKNLHKYMYINIEKENFEFMGSCAPTQLGN